MPDSAKNIRFAAYAEGVALEEYVKFEAPAKDCIAYRD